MFEQKLVMPPPYIAWIDFEILLKSRHQPSVPFDDNSPLELQIFWSMHITAPQRIFSFQQGVPVSAEAMLNALIPSESPVLLLDYSEDDPTDNVYVKVIERDKRIIAWYHDGLKGLMRPSYGTNQASSIESFPNPIYLSKQYNRHMPMNFAHGIATFAHAFPNRLHGAYTKSLQKSVSAFLNASLPEPCQRTP